MPGTEKSGIRRRIWWPQRHERPRDLLHRLERAVFVRAPHLDDDRRSGLGDPPGFAKRGDHVVREEERGEARDEIEGGVLVGQ